jgi:hypothetical protein
MAGGRADGPVAIRKHSDEENKVTTIPTDDLSVFESTIGLEAYQPVVFNAYRDIHKGIRAELFEVTSAAGRLDPGDSIGWMALVNHLTSVESTLATHAGHEDAHIEPVLVEIAPTLADQIAEDHRRLEARFAAVHDLAAANASCPASEQRPIADLVYLELSGFTSEYLRHQLVEERVVMPRLEQALGVDGVVAVNAALVASIPPDQRARSMAFMLPAMNVEDRVEMIDAIRSEAPAEVFQGVMGLARSVLDSADAVALASRLGL